MTPAQIAAVSYDAPLGRVYREFIACFNPEHAQADIINWIRRLYPAAHHFDVSDDLVLFQIGEGMHMMCKLPLRLENCGRLRAEN